MAVNPIDDLAQYGVGDKVPYTPVFFSLPSLIGIPHSVVSVEKIRATFVKTATEKQQPEYQYIFCPICCSCTGS